MDVQTIERKEDVNYSQHSPWLGSFLDLSRSVLMIYEQKVIIADRRAKCFGTIGISTKLPILEILNRRELLVLNNTMMKDGLQCFFINTCLDTRVY